MLGLVVFSSTVHPCWSMAYLRKYSCLTLYVSIYFQIHLLGNFFFVTLKSVIKMLLPYMRSK